MKLLLRLLACSFITAFLCAGALGQTNKAEMNSFTKDGLAFEYPGGWTITDESTLEALQVVVTRKGSSVQVTIIAKRGFTLSKDLPAANRDIAEPLVRKVATLVEKAERSDERAPLHIQVGAIKADGVRFHSSASKRPSTGEVFWLRNRLRFIALGFVRSDADESEGSQLWETIRASLKVDGPVVGVITQVEPSAAGSIKSGAIEGGVVNGKALRLPHPAYPRIARMSHAAGVVTVQVIIDEQGDVIAARAVSGHPLLFAASVSAARQAKFSPTRLEDEPVKVTGVITYNFVAQ